MAITMEAIKTLRESTGAGILDCRNALTATDGDIEKAADWLREKGIAKAAKKASRIAAEGLCDIAVNGNSAAIVEINSETDFVAKNEKFQGLVKGIANAVVNANVNSVEEANTISYAGATIADAIVSATSTIGEKISFRRFEKIAKNDNQSFGSYIHMGGKIGVVVLVEGANKEELANDIAMQVAAMSPTYVAIENVPSDVVEHEKEVQLASAKNDPKLQDKPEAALKSIIEGKVRKQLSDSCLLEQEFVKDGSKKVGQYVKEQGSAVVKFVRYNVGEGMEHREDNFAEEVMSQMK